MNNSKNKKGRSRMKLHSKEQMDFARSLLSRKRRSLQQTRPADIERSSAVCQPPHHQEQNNSDQEREGANSKEAQSEEDKILAQVAACVSGGFLSQEDGDRLVALWRSSPSEERIRQKLQNIQQRMQHFHHQQRSERIRVEVEMAAVRGEITEEESRNLQRLLQMDSNTISSLGRDATEDASLDWVEAQLHILKEANSHEIIDKERQKKEKLKIEVEWGMAFNKILEEEGDNLLRLLEISDENTECVGVVERQLELLRGMEPQGKADVEQQRLPSYLWRRLSRKFQSFAEKAYASHG